MARILLIQNGDESRARLRQMLELIGHEVVEARDSKEGMQIFRIAPVDVVVTDLIMQGLGGFGLVPELRRANPGAVIIALHRGSSGNNNRLLALAAKYGARRTLLGPLDPKKLIDAVDDCLKPRLH